MKKYGKTQKLNMHHGAVNRSLLVDRMRKANREKIYLHSQETADRAKRTKKISR